MVVHFAVCREWQFFNRDKSAWHHVSGQPGFEKRAQPVERNRLARNNKRGQSVGCRQYSTLVDFIESQDCIFNMTRFDTVATYFALAVGPANVMQLTVCI